MYLSNHYILVSSTDNQPLNSNVDIAVWLIILLLFFGLITYSITEFLSSFTLAIFFYYSTRPLFRYLSKYKWLQNRNWRSLITISIGVIPLLVLFGYTVTVILTETRSLIVEYDFTVLNSYLPNIFTQDFITVVQQPIIIFENANGIDPELIQQIGEWSGVMVGFLSEVLINISLTLFIVFYLLRDDHKIGDWIHTQMHTITPMWHHMWEKIDSDLHIVFYGNILNMFFTGFISIVLFVSYNLIAPDTISITYPFLLGALSGLASLLPIIGTKLTYIPLTGYLSIISYLEGDYTLLAIVLILLVLAFILIDFIPDMIIRPYLSSQNIHPGIILFGYISGATIIGWYGFFLAPIIIVVIYNVIKIMLPRILYTVFQNRI